MLAIGQKLDRLAEFHRQMETLEKDKQKLIDQVLPPEIKARLEEIEAEFTNKAEAAQASIETLEGEIKSEVISHGESVRGAAFQAVWTKGRQSWDGKGLTTYSESHPDILQFRKEGEPSVAIRRAASKDND
jgi:phage terminase small subunit